MVIRHPNPHVSVGITLDRIEGLRTRLVTRLRVGSRLERWWPLYLLLFDPGDFVLMRGMLLGIKRRAERAWADTTAIGNGARPAG
jgi:hypothetical protein